MRRRADFHLFCKLRDSQNSHSCLCPPIFSCSFSHVVASFCLCLCCPFRVLTVCALRCVVLCQTEPPLNPPENREYAAEIMFETFNIPGTCLVRLVLLLASVSSLQKQRPRCGSGCLVLVACGVFPPRTHVCLFDVYLSLSVCVCVCVFCLCVCLFALLVCLRGFSLSGTHVWLVRRLSFSVCVFGLCLLGPGLYIGVQAVLALAASWTPENNGNLTGTVIDSGDGVTHVIPVVDGYVIGSCIKNIPLAGKDIFRIHPTRIA